MCNVGAPVLCMRHKLLVCRALSLVFARTLLPSQLLRKYFESLGKSKRHFPGKTYVVDLSTAVGEVVLEELKREIIVFKHPPFEIYTECLFVEFGGFGFKIRFSVHQIFE